MTDVLNEHRELLTRNLERVENRLRLLADKVAQERERVQHVPGPGSASFIDIFTGVQSDILWGVANMNLPQYANNAAWADIVFAEQRAKREA